MKRKYKKKKQSKRAVLKIGLVLLVMTAVYYMASTVYGVYKPTTEVQAPITVPEPVKPIVYTPEDWLAAVNAERAKHGIKPLKLDVRLNASAQKKADEMSKEVVDEDNDPHTNAQGVHGYTYAQKAVPKCRYASENVAPFYQSPVRTVELWMHSPPHKKAILDPKYDITGFGYDEVSAVEHFCAL